MGRVLWAKGGRWAIELGGFVIDIERCIGRFFGEREEGFFEFGQDALEIVILLMGEGMPCLAFVDDLSEDQGDIVIGACLDGFLEEEITAPREEGRIGGLERLDASVNLAHPLAQGVFRELIPKAICAEQEEIAEERLWFDSFGGVEKHRAI